MLSLQKPIGRASLFWKLQRPSYKASFPWVQPILCILSCHVTSPLIIVAAEDVISHHMQGLLYIYVETIGILHHRVCLGWMASMAWTVRLSK